MLATNASGARAFRHGYTRDHVVRLRAVLDNGDAVEVGRQSRWPTPEATHGRLEDIVSSVVTLLEQHAGTIETCRPRTRFNRCGYLLHDVLDAETLDLARLLVGSEGTLALFTEATLRTIPLPGGRAVVLLGFASLDAALRAAAARRADRPGRLRTDRSSSAASGAGSDSTVAALIPAAVEAVLLVEYEADTPAEAGSLARDLADRLHRGERLAILAHVAEDAEASSASGRCARPPCPACTVCAARPSRCAFVEDVGVPPELLPGYLHRVQEVLQRHETTASYPHPCRPPGQVHMRPFVEWRGHEDGARLWALADEVYGIVLDLGGTISAQHGTGLARTPWVSRQAGPLFSVFRELKSIFDPRHLFNPGKIIGPLPGAPAWPLRRRRTAGVSRRVTSLHPPAERRHVAAAALARRRRR